MALSAARAQQHSHPVGSSQGWQGPSLTRRAAECQGVDFPTVSRVLPADALSAGSGRVGCKSLIPQALGADQLTS